MHSSTNEVTLSEDGIHPLTSDTQMPAPLDALDNRMIILPLAYLVFFHVAQVFAFICVQPNVTTYLRTEGYTLKQLPSNNVSDVTLYECASLCTKSDACDSFQYDSSKLECALSNAAGIPPEATSLLTIAHDVVVFQKICIETSSLCPSPYAFERYPRHLLVGNALEVIQAEGVSKCLASCLEAKKLLQIECRSVMYYYGTGECILNRESRLSLPHLFINDSTHLGADYFDNMCLDVKCLEGWSVHWINIEPFEMSDHSDIVLEDVTKDECLRSCLENSIHGHPFPCKVFAYAESQSTCHLTVESGIGRERSIEGKHRERSLVAAEKYYEKICLHGVPSCGKASFQYTAHRVLADAPTQILPASTVTACLEACLKATRRCIAAMFFHEKEECALASESHLSESKHLHFQSEVDYYDNLCDYSDESEMRNPDEAVEESPPVVVSREPINVQLPGRAQTNPHVIVDNAALVNDASIDKGELETECHVDGIVVSVRFASSITGAIYIKDHFSTCRAEFENVTKAMLRIELPSLRHNNPPCPAEEIKPSVWSFIVVVQRNGLDVPAVITDMDRIFNVSCDYSNVDISAANTVLDPSLEQIDVAQKEDSSSERIFLSVLREGQPVSSVVLGEELELRWTTVGIQHIDFQVAECFADRLDGSPPYPPPLKLVSGGCTSTRARQLMPYPITAIKDGFTTMIKAFRFDGSRRVRIVCTIDICESRCPQARCETNNNEPNKRFYERTRRTTNEFDMTDEATWVSWEGSQRLKRASIEGTLTIIENVNGGNKVIKEEGDRKTQTMETKAQRFGAQSIRGTMECNPSLNEYICIVPVSFAMLVAALTIMGAIQTLQILAYVYFRWQKRKSNVPGSETSSASNNTNISEYGFATLNFMTSRGMKAELRQRGDGDYISEQSSSRTANPSKLPHR